MRKSTGKNQGLCVLRELVCDAIPLGPFEMRSAVVRARGKNQGMMLVEEVVVNNEGDEQNLAGPDKSSPEA